MSEAKPLNDTERVYFKGDDRPGEWREVVRGQKTVKLIDVWWERFLFRCRDKQLDVFAPVTTQWEAYDRDIIDLLPPPPDGPLSHAHVWASLVRHDRQLIIDTLGPDALCEPLVGQLQPIGCLPPLSP